MSLSGKQTEKRIQRDLTKKESERFHSRWLKKVMPAALDAVEMADKVGKAVEDAVELPQELCLARHQKLGPARTLKVISLQSALSTRARMEMCYALPWRRWQRT
jgi:hypothetical protein